MNAPLPPYRRPLPVLARRLLAGGLLAWAGAQSWADEPAPTPVPPLEVLARAEQRVSQLEELLDKASRARWSAWSLGQSARDAEQAWQGLERTDQQAREDLDLAAGCLPGLRAELEAGAAAATALERAIAASHQATRALAAAPAARLEHAAAQSATAFRQRAEAEQALVDQGQRLREKSWQCAGRVAEAHRSVERALDAYRWFGEEAARGPETLGELAADWATALAAWRSGRIPGVVSPPAPPPSAPDGEPLRRLGAALPTVPAGAPALDMDTLRVPERQDTDLPKLAAGLARLEDAATYLDLASDPRLGGCQAPQCAAFAAERASLAPRLAAARGALASARQRLTETSASLVGLLSPHQAALEGNREAWRPVEGLVAPAIAVATEAGRAIGDAAQALEDSARDRLDVARREWERAYAQVHGTPPPETEHPKLTAADGAAGGAAGGLTAAPAPAPMGREIRSHAYAVFDGLDTEPMGFGAYTYVLVRGAEDLRKPAVRLRYLRLLATLRNLPHAALVTGGDKPQVNLFCIPGSYWAGAGDAEEALYDPILGQQLKLRAQNGLLTHSAIARRLTRSPGPFLLTLPGRIADVAIGSPLLFADLSDYPEAAIADLAASYMNGLVDDFPSRQALWKPPVAQRVALAMIWLASGANGILSSVFPAAQAGDAP